MGVVLALLRGRCMSRSLRFLSSSGIWQNQSTQPQDGCACCVPRAWEEFGVSVESKSPGDDTTLTVAGLTDAQLPKHGLTAIFRFMVCVQLRPLSEFWAKLLLLESSGGFLPSASSCQALKPRRKAWKSSGQSGQDAPLQVSHPVICAIRSLCPDKGPEHCQLLL